MQEYQEKKVLNNPRKEKRITTWDCIWFGHYPQSDATGKTKEPIRWRVLCVEGNDAFIMADRNLDMQQYNASRQAVSWEDCTMRSWLNGYGSDCNLCGIDYSNDNFLNRAFTSEEQEAIMVTNVVNGMNPKSKVSGGRDTQDKIFLLSFEEVTNADYGFDSNYMKYGEGRKPKHTAYVDAGGTIHSDEGRSANGRFSWWLRTPGKDAFYAANVQSYGSVSDYGLWVDRCDYAVRPALHLNLEQAECWSYAGTICSKELEGLTVVRGKTTYEVGEKLTLENMAVTALYSNEGEKIIKSYKTNIKDIDMSTEGTKELKISYTERGMTKTATVEIDVIKSDYANIPNSEEPQTLENPKPDWKGIVAWDCIYFGHYPQSDITGKENEPIRWRVLYVEGNDAFLVADRCLDIQKYNETDDDATWETSTIRSWLNGYGSSANNCGIDYIEDNFLKRAFSPEEQRAIRTTVVINDDNYEHETPGGNTTRDKVFFLSYDEAATALFGFDTDAGDVFDYATRRYYTAYSANLRNQQSEADSEKDFDENSEALWMLRSPGSHPNYVGYVMGKGSRGRSGVKFGQWLTGICPALHLNLAATELWAYAGKAYSDGADDAKTLVGKAKFAKELMQRRVSKKLLEDEYI